MRNEEEIKQRIQELKNAIDEFKKIEGVSVTEAHAARGELFALFWVLGFSDNDAHKKTLKIVPLD